MQKTNPSQHVSTSFFSGKLAYYLLFFAGFGDAQTTIYGLQHGFSESRAFFFPFIAPGILALTVYLVNRKEVSKAPSKVRKAIVCFSVLLSFSGLLWNLGVLTK